MEINHISNRELKYNIGNTAINLLLSSQEIKESDLANIVLEFGYLFQKEDGEFEVLFKIISGIKIYYFAIQNSKLMRIAINEAQFKDLVERMEDFHECLKNNNNLESEKQRNRRLKNNQHLTSRNITINENLNCLFNDENIELKSIDEICKRAIACLLTTQIACDINSNGNYKESVEFFMPIYKNYNVESSVNSKEQRILDGSYNQQDAVDMDWAYEAYWALCWCLGLVDDISNPGVLCDCNKAISFVLNSSTLKDFERKCKLRSIEEILDMHDLYFRYNWAVNHSKVDSNTSLGNINSSNVIERRRALEWVLSSEDDWYNLTLAA